MNSKPISVYRRSFSNIKRRLKWDLTYASRLSRKQLDACFNSHTGQKAVIVCNGPSLLQCDMDSLKNTFTFGLNKINLLYDKTDWRPSCIVSVNRHVIEQNADYFNNTGIPLYLGKNGVSHVKAREGVAFLYTGGEKGLFSGHCGGLINEGHTVTYVAMQLAFHMGFKEVGLIGCDHNFATKGPANQAVKADESDPNHFDPNYFSGGVTWQLPDLVMSEYHYQLAGENYTEDGRSIINCTVGGKLEIFPRMDLKDFVAQ